MPKPKPKSEEEKKAALDRMLSMAATTNHLTGAGAVAAPAEPASGSAAALSPAHTTGIEEQEGEKALPAPTGETAATVPDFEPALVAALAAPTPSPAPEPTAAEPAQAPAAALVAPGAADPAGKSAPEEEHSSEAISESAATVEVSNATVEAGSFDLTSLFIPPAEKKTAQMRLTNSHYQYLLLLGTIVGGGATPPDIVYNLIQQFIDKHDPQVQKAISKQLRQRQGKK
ncbi:hypothetical protein [Hymenobacter glacieicola]|uniref:DUF3408 domain-containing protein n=1 Tax=Hymenobacter glacieicola TaxID=1562124 RepID=A0ABQ1X4M3_9BACT|nr:hypothetical protein [Hymenobacter glacieicola]GGG59799.1 hypothetical protein GCM10011378_39730 [Hymenobacter glacieicola]